MLLAALEHADVRSLAARFGPGDALRVIAVVAAAGARLVVADGAERGHALFALGERLALLVGQRPAHGRGPLKSRTSPPSSSMQR